MDTAFWLDTRAQGNGPGPLIRCHARGYHRVYRQDTCVDCGWHPDDQHMDGFNDEALRRFFVPGLPRARDDPLYVKAGRVPPASPRLAPDQPDQGTASPASIMDLSLRPHQSEALPAPTLSAPTMTPASTSQAPSQEMPLTPPHQENVAQTAQTVARESASRKA